MDRSAPRTLTLVASDVAPIGGMERVAYEITTRLLDRGWQVTVISRSCALAPSPRLKFVRLPSPSRPVALALALDLVFGSLALLRHGRGIVQTNEAVIANRVDVINVHFCERAYRRHVGVSRSRKANAMYRLNSWLTSVISEGLERWCFRPGRVARLTCVSPGVGREVREEYPAAGALVSVIPNGVDRASFAPDAALRSSTREGLGLDPQSHIALFVGGDWRRKGLAHAIDALGSAPGWRLLVAGEGEATEFAERARAAGTESRVMFLGKVAEPAAVYAAADVFVLPSAYETFSMVAHEAAAAGLPLVLPRLHGIEELVEDGVNGWFTEASGPAIAERLRVLAADPELARAMGEAARRSTERYGWEQIVDSYEELYASLGSGGGS